MKSIVLAEKPSVAKELARVLKCVPKTKNYYENESYIVTWALGHLVELVDPDEYTQEWKEWKMEALPMLPEKMRYHVIRKTTYQFNAIKSLFSRQDVNNLIIATDAGREGELVARLIMRLGGWKGNFQRLWISSQTDSAIRNGFASLKPGIEYDNLSHAAECRSEADWVIGLNITRALTCKHDARLSAGRVQTPTLAMIVRREKEISSFVPYPYWTIEADFGSFKGMWQGKNGNKRFTKKEDAEKIAEKIRETEGLIKTVKTEEKSEPAPLAYDLTALQGDANRFLNFSAKKTLDVLQGLYERHKIVTYPRTDSRHITEDMVPTLKERLKAISSTKFAAYAKDLLKTEIKPGKRFVDGTKVSDHHAIIPTEEPVSFERLTIEEKQLWELIARRFIAVLMPAYQYKKNTVTAEVKGEEFVARGIQTLSLGWRAVSGSDTNDQDEDDSLQNLAACREGAVVKVVKVTLPQGMTKPPARYTEGTLLAAMENAGNYIEDKTLKASIERGGLGTPATRADIIEKLFAGYYIERHGKELVPTPQGIELIKIVPEELRSPELTAEWELRFTRIAKGTENSKNFIADIRTNARRLVEEVKNSTVPFAPANSSGVACPMCGKQLMAVNKGKAGKILVCPSRSCGYEQKEQDDDSLKRRQTPKEKAMVRKLINKYSDNDAKSTFTLGDLLKMSEDKKRNK